MEFQRIILFVALVFVSLMLYNAWQKEHPAGRVTSSQQQASQTKTKDSQTSATEVGTLPPAPAAQTPVKATQASSKGLPKNGTLYQAVPAKRLITVKTDVLNVKIDTLGGNIVGLNLPKYPVSLDTPNNPVQLLNDNPNTLYVAESALVSPQGPDTLKTRGHYTASQNSYQMGADQKTLKVDLNWKGSNGLQVTKQYIFHRGDYLVNVQYLVNNNNQTDWQGKLYTQITRKDYKANSAGWFQVHPYVGAAYSTPSERYQELKFSKFASEPLNINAQGGWAAMVQHYFLTAWVPNAKADNHYYTKAWDNGAYTIGIISPTIKVAANSKQTIGAKLFSGPELVHRLKEIAPGLNLTVSYGWLWPISSFLFWFMELIHHVVGNWGWAIVFVTILIKLAFYPLSSMSYRSMANMRKLQPKIEALRERFADDKQGMSKAMMELYKKEKVNPLSGCLPILVQIPFFFALYMVLIENVAFRQAPWILWIKDLSIPDPFYILPIVMGVSMFIQQKLSPPPPDPTQAKVMMLLPVVFTFLFAHFPSGLVLYWSVNNILSILQQWYVTRSVEKAHLRKSAQKSQKNAHA